MQRRIISGRKNQLTHQASRLTKFFVGLITVAFATVVVESAEAAPRYRIVDLGATNPAPDGIPLNQVRRINNANQIVGDSYSSGMFSALLNPDLTINDIQLRTPSTSPIDLNNAGTSLFNAAVTYQETRVGLFTGESYVLTHPMGWYFQVQGIGDSNDIVGIAYTTNFNPVPTIMKWDRQTQSVISTQQISPFPSGIGYAFDVNSNGTVVGSGATEEYAPNNDRIWHAFSWRDGVTTPLLPPSSYLHSRAIKINNSGQVVGVCSNSGAMEQGDVCTWINGQVTVLDLPTLPPSIDPYFHPYSQNEPVAINNSGQIIGSFSGGSFFWENGESVILNDRIDTPGYTLTNVSDINDNGVIAATAQRPFSQEYIAVLLVPVDENPNSTSDTISPITSYSSTLQQCGGGWFDSQVPVELAASDDRPGTLVTYYKIDDGIIETYSGQFLVSGNGTHRLEFWSVDQAGNGEVHKIRTIRIDSIGPSITVTQTLPAANALGWNRTPVEVSYQAEDNPGGSGLSYVYPASPLRFATEGANQTESITATDVAWNTTVYTPSAVNLDFTVPNTTAQIAGSVGNGGIYRSPVEITLSAADNLSGIKTSFYKIDGGSAQRYNAPFTIAADGSHSIIFWSVDKADNVEIENNQTISIDATFPTTTASISGPAGDNGWYRGNAQVTLNVTDGSGSGIAAKFYKINGGATQTYTAPFTVAGNAIHQVIYWSTDVAGNQEQPAKSLTIKIDAIAPTLVWGSTSPAPNAQGWNNTATQIPFTTSDNLSGVASAIPVSPLRFTAEGTGQTKTVTVKDLAGNSTVFTSPVVNLDTVVPSSLNAITGIMGTNNWYKANVQVILSVFESGSGIVSQFYKIDNGATRSYTAPIAVTGDAVHEVIYWGVDKAGNQEPANFLTVKIDGLEPTSAAILSGVQGDNGWYKSNVQVTLDANDAISGVAAKFYKVDNGATQTYTAPFTVSGDGSHQVSYWSRDIAGNQEQLSQLVTFKIDTVAPTVAWGSTSPAPNSQGWNNAATEIPFTTSDNLSGVATAMPVSPLRFDAEGAGQTKTVIVKDRAGNSRIYTSRLVNIDTIAPISTGTIAGVQGDNGWYKANVQVALNATDAGSGVANKFYKIDGGATQTYTAPFAVTGDAVHQVTYWSTDIAGNQDQPARSVTIKIDGAVPALTWGLISPAPNPQGWNNTATEIPFTTFDNLSGIASAAPISPLRFTAEGANQSQNVTATDVAGNVSVFASPFINIDFAVPVTTAQLSGTVGNDGSYVGTVGVTLTAADSLSGIKSTFYKIDNGATQIYNAPLSVAGDGSHSLIFWSTDKAGNAENDKNQTISIDTTAPVTIAEPSGSLGNSGWYKGNVEVTLSAGDGAGRGVASTYYKVDGNASQIYTNRFLVSGNGTHTVEFWSVDKAGNTEVHQTLALRIDSSAPSITWGASTPAANAGGWNRTAVERTYTVVDNAAGSGIGTVVPVSPLRFAGEGANQTQVVTATDVAGNAATFTSPVVSLDFTAPATTAQPSGTVGNAGFYVGAVQIALTASDSLSGVENTFYKIDGGSAQTFASPFSINGDGAHNVVYWSVDRAGNVENSRTITFSIDTTSPVSSHALNGTAGDNGWYKNNVQVTLSAADGNGVASTVYQVDGTATQTYNQPFVVSGDAVHTVTYYSTDAAGNKELSRSATIKIDATTPAVAWGGIVPTPNALGWNNTATDIPFTASDNLSAVASATPASPLRFSLEGAGQTRSVSVMDSAGNSAVFTSPSVNLDLTAPVSAANFTGTVGTNGWYVSNVQGALSTADATGSGVLSTSYNLDGGAAQNYTAPFAVTQDGTRIVNFWGKDKAGNTETAKSATVKIDKIAPLITAVANPTSLTSTKTFKPVVISGKMTDAASGINAGSASYSTVDEYGSVKPAGTITVQADGSYSFTVSLEAKRNSGDKDGRAYTISIRCSDRAGLQATQTVIVRVL